MSISILSLFFCGGCSVLWSSEKEIPTIALPRNFTNSPENTKDFDLSKPWWLAYKDEDLNRIIDKTLASNLSLQAAWQRLEQAKSMSKITSSQQIPSVSVGASGSRTKSRTETISSDGTSTTYVNQYSSSFSLGPSLSYEVDLWNRIGATVQSGELQVEATRQDIENTALLLSGQIANLWMSAQEQKAAIRLLRDQVTLSKKLLKLTKYKFDIGQSSALDIYQQETQLRATLSQLPLAKSAFLQTLNQLAVLTGEAPGAIKASAIKGELPALPPLPNVRSPIELLDSRPDMRSWKARLVAADLDVDAAKASRFPSLNFSLSYTFQAQNLSDLFLGQLGQLLASVSEPIIEGGRISATIDERKANWEGLKDQFKESVLNAMSDVENALIDEREKIKYLKLLEEQKDFADASLREARERYMNGLIGYLQVAFNVQSLQSIERAYLSSKSDLLRSRNRLYLALGGDWTKDLGLPKEDKK